MKNEMNKIIHKYYMPKIFLHTTKNIYKYIKLDYIPFIPKDIIRSQTRAGK